MRHMLDVQADERDNIRISNAMGIYEGNYNGNLRERSSNYTIDC